MSALTDYIPISTYLASEIGTQYGLKGENKIITNDGIALAAEGEGGCVNCEATCAGTCVAVCAGSCVGSCVNACATACAGNCTGTCTGSCTGTCSSSCTGSCASACTGSCVGDCTGNCAGTCTNQCETYCAGPCQTYCLTEQTYSQNHGPNNPGGKPFTWKTFADNGEMIGFKEDEIIEIKAKGETGWNTLATYVEQAIPFCTTRTAISLSKVEPLDLITAKIFNNLDNGIGLISTSIGTKVADIDLIKAKEINALASNYNKAQMLDTLPLTNGQVSGKCCQRGESCMTLASGRPSLQPCLKGQICSQACTQSPGSSL